MKHKILFLINLFLISSGYAQLSPLITSWWINTTKTGFGGAITNVQEVNYSSTYVYVKTKDIPSWIPVLYDWPNNPWFAVPMNYQFRIRLNPTPNVGPQTKTGYGHIGLWKNGCSIYNPKDAKSYKDSSVWFQNAWFWEHLIAETFDSCIGHPNQSGEYHTHVSPSCLYNIYDSTNVSPLLGYAFDGYPIYGGYGYSKPLDTTSTVKRLKSSYRLRNITARTSLPDGTILPNYLYGPRIDTNITSLNPLNNTPPGAPLGAYMEDYEYINGLGDLDEHNGRFCITKEYPKGIYAYFTTIDWATDHFGTEIKPAFPYVLGTAYYGKVFPTDGNTGPGSGFVVISEPVTRYFGTNAVAATDLPIDVSIYPNPVSEELIIDATTIKGNQYISCNIFNHQGQLIDTTSISLGVKNVINCDKLSDGIYFVNFQNGTYSKNYKIVISR